MFYIATLERADGQQALCNTSDSSCYFSGLPCGQTYTVTVSAEGQSCNSSQSTGPPIMTGKVCEMDEQDFLLHGPIISRHAPGVNAPLMLMFGCLLN